MDDSHRLASCDTSLVVSGGVDCGRRLNVYDKKPRRYAKDNRTAHLTAHSDKSVAYVTNNKTLLDVLYCRSKLLTDMKHRAASLRQQSYLYLEVIRVDLYCHLEVTVSQQGHFGLKSTVSQKR